MGECPENTNDRAEERSWKYRVCVAGERVLLVWERLLRKPSREQSRSELIVANSAWATLTFCIVMLIARLPSMLSLRFLDEPERRPTIRCCLKKLIRGTMVYFIVTFLVMIACSSVAAYLSVVKPSVFKYKLDCYVGTLSTHGFFTGITLAAKRIYSRETCQGRERLALTQQTAGASTNITQTTATKEQPALVSFRVAYALRSYNFWRVYIKEFPKSAPAALAGAFVHLLSQQQIMDRGATVLTCFVLASTLLKLAIQESTKHYILKKRIRSTKFMCAAVALPTVLIDTQTRIILLGTKNIQFVAMGTLGMALIEIILRVGKASLVMRAIHNREAKIPQQQRVPSHSPLSERVDFELWRRRLQAYLIAEINADTYAEYIAIGCSASILFFLGDHPHYSLLRHPESGELKSQRGAQLKMLVFQIGVEVVVDFVSTLLEMMAGIEFDLIQNLGSFLTVLFMVTAVLNVNISIGIYLI